MCLKKKKKKKTLNSPRDLCNLLFRFAVNDMSMIKCFLKICCTDQGKNFGKPPSFPLGWEHLVLFCFLILAVLGLCRGMLVGSLVVVCGLSCSAAPGILVPLIRDWAHVPCTGRQILHHWTTREVPRDLFSFSPCFYVHYPISFSKSAWGRWMVVDPVSLWNEELNEQVAM